MRPLPYVDIPQGAGWPLSRGLPPDAGGLKRPLKAGEKVEITLLFQDGTRLKVLLPVEMR